MKNYLKVTKSRLEAGCLILEYPDIARIAHNFAMNLKKEDIKNLIDIREQHSMGHTLTIKQVLSVAKQLSRLPLFSRPAKRILNAWKRHIKK